MDKLMPLQQLFMFEALAAFIADKPTAIVVFRLLMVYHRTGMVELLTTDVAWKTFLFSFWLKNKHRTSYKIDRINLDTK